MYDTNVASSLTFHDPELELASVGVLIFPTRSQMSILAFIHDPLEIKNIMKSQGIPDYTAPPPIPDFSRHNEIFDEIPDYD
jgi:hypothetical protein